MYGASFSLSSELNPFDPPTHAVPKAIAIVATTRSFTIRI